MSAAIWIARVRGWVYYPTYLSLLLGSSIAGLFSTREFEAGDYTWRDWILFVAAALLLVTTAALAVLRDRGQGADLLSARTKLRTDVGDALDPVIEELGQMINAAAKERAHSYGRVYEMLLRGACELAGPSEGRIRATFFEYLVDGPNGEGLYSRGSAARTQTHYNFLAGTPDGDEALARVKQNECYYEPNVRESPPASWHKNKSAEYESFLSVPCWIKGRPVGMVTVDSTYGPDITEADVPMVMLVGRLIGVALLLKS